MPGSDLMLWLVPTFFAGALLYALVGHGGVPAYLAIMALAGFAPPEMKPAVLAIAGTKLAQI